MDCNLDMLVSWITDFLEGTTKVIDIDDTTTGLVSVTLILEDPVGKAKISFV